MKSLTKSATITAFLLLISKLLGFLRELCLADRFGTSFVADAYTVAITLPSVLFTIFASGFAQSYIPTYSRLPKERQGSFFRNTATILCLVSLVVTGVCFLLSETLASVLAPGFRSEPLTLTARFIHVIVFHLPFFTLFNLLSAHVQAEEDFIVPSFCDYIVVNLVNIACILASGPARPMPLVYGYVLAMMLATVLLSVYSKRRYHLSYRPCFHPKDPDFRALCTLAIPLGLSLLANQLNAVVDRMFSSGLGEGITSSLGYAAQLQSILLTLTTTIFLQVCYPRMNRYFAAGKKEQGMSYACRAALIACYTSVPLIVLFVAYAEPIVHLIFERGSFTETSTAYTATCLRFYALGILFFAIRTILTNVLAANTKQRLILKNTVITVVCNIILNVVLIRAMGYAGLPLATSLSGLIACCLMLRDVRRLELHLLERSQRRDMLCVCAGTAAALLGSIPAFSLLQGPLGSDGAIFLTIVLSALVYALTTILMKPNILLWLYPHLPARLRILKSYDREIGEYTDE